MTSQKSCPPVLDCAIYAGKSPNTGKPMYVAPADAPLELPFDDARQYAAELKAYGHADWRLPTKDELSVLFVNREVIGGFNLTGCYPTGHYWSVTPFYAWSAWGQRFSDGWQGYDSKDAHLSVRGDFMNLFNRMKKAKNTRSLDEAQPKLLAEITAITLGDDCGDVVVKVLPAGVDLPRRTPTPQRCR